MHSQRKLKPKATKTVNVGLKIEKCVLYTCLRKNMRLCRWFGFCPLEGFDSIFISRLRFNIKSFYTVYLLLTVIGQVLMLIISFWSFLVTELSITMFNHLMFYFSSTLSTLLLIKLCRTLPKLIKEMSEIEGRVIRFKLTKETYMNIALWSYLIWIMAFFEHAFCIMYVWKFVTNCLQIFDFSFPAVNLYFTLKMEYVSHYTSFNFWGGVLLEITNLQATFMWNFVDVFVITIGIYLSSYFKELNKKIQTEKNNLKTNWGRLRAQYSNLVALVKRIDSEISSFVIISFSSNLVSTCMQLFKSLKVTDYDFGRCNQKGALEAIDSWEHDLFYTFSFLLLLLRTVVMSLVTANVNTYAHEPLVALGEVHATKYNFEIQRFTRQLTYAEVGVSGVFFTVTRRLIIKILRTLITYELVLIQFNHRYSDSYNDTSDANSTMKWKKVHFTF